MITAYWRHLHLFSRDARLVLSTTALAAFSYLAIYTMLFNLYLLRLGYGPQFIGLINAGAQLTFALFSLPAGALGRRWGARRTSMLGLSITVVTFLALPLAELFVGEWQQRWLMLTYLTAWLGGALYLVNSYPLLMQATDPAERNHVFSVRQALSPMGNFLGHLVGGILPGGVALLLAVSLDHPAPFRYGLVVAALALIPGVLALRAVQVDTQPQTRQARTATTDPAPIELIAFMALLMFLHVGAVSAANTFFGVYLDDYFHLSPTWIGLLAAAGQLLAIPMALVTPTAIARWGKRQTILIGFLGSALSLLPMALVPHWGAAGLSFIALNALVAFTTPALFICQQEIVAPSWRPLMSGAIVMARGGSTALMAFSGGYLITAFGYPTLFLTGALLAALGGGLIWIYTWFPRQLIIRRVAVNL